MASGNQVGFRRRVDFPPEEFIARRERIFDAIGRMSLPYAPEVV